MRRIIGKKIAEISVSDLIAKAKDYLEVVLDLGAGDGRFAYDYAKSHPESFVVGVDADKSQMQDISAKADRKPEKGGLENVVYIWSAVEALPADLQGIADHVFINFPWGSLLAGVMNSDPEFVTTISNLLKPGGKLTILVSYDERFEPETMAKLELSTLTAEFITGELAQKYAVPNLTLTDWQVLNDEQKRSLHGSWPKKLNDSRGGREVFEINFEKK